MKFKLCCSAAFLFAVASVLIVGCGDSGRVSDSGILDSISCKTAYHKSEFAGHSYVTSLTRTWRSGYTGSDEHSTTMHDPDCPCRESKE